MATPRAEAGTSGQHRREHEMPSDRDCVSVDSHTGEACEGEECSSPTAITDQDDRGERPEHPGRNQASHE